jgi:hypothetical protein
MQRLQDRSTLVPLPGLGASLAMKPKSPARPENGNYRTAVEANFLTMASSSLRSLSLRFVE